MQQKITAFGSFAMACLAVTFPSSTRADFPTITMSPTIGADFAMIELHNSVLRQSGEDQRAEGGTKRARELGRQSVAVRPTYVASPARTRANLANFVAKTRQVDPAGAAKMAQLFASTDVIGRIDQRMQATYGMRANNVADAYAIYWTSAWLGAQGRNDNPSREQMTIIKRQVANAFAATPRFATMADAGKQELAEAMLVQAMFIGATITAVKSDPAMLTKARAAIAQGARAMGLDLSSMTLTDEGFKPARKTGKQHQSLPQETETDLAAATPDTVTPATTGSTRSDQDRTNRDDQPPYLLMAAASGAGLGGAFILGKALAKRG